MKLFFDKILENVLGVTFIGLFMTSLVISLAGLDIAFALLAIISGYLFVDITKIETKGE